MTVFRYIADKASLQRICLELEAADAIAVDTEFIRESTYYPRLCLIQVATENYVACIDALGIQSLDPLFDIFHDGTVTKVFHAARQDLEILFHLTGRVPAPIFDTQVAAGMLGFADQAGYAAVVAGVLGVELDKAHTRTDWTRRPLPSAALEYAADDVRYLIQLYPLLLERLQARGRLAWLEAELDTLTDPATYRPAPGRAWRRIRGHRRLKPRELARLAGLAAWRETYAMEQDKPRQWVVRDALLVEIARHGPVSMDQLERIRGLGTGFARQHGKAMLDALADAKATAPPIEHSPAVRLEPEQEAMVDVLMAVLRQLGPAQDINAVTLASRKDLERLVLGERDLPVLQGWRREAAGQILLDALEGRTRLDVENGIPVLRTGKQPDRSD